MHASEDTPNITIQSNRIHSGIDILEAHGVICKFLGIILTQNAIEAWIIQNWKTKGEITISHYSNGYWLALFANIKDKDDFLNQDPSSMVELAFL